MRCNTPGGVRKKVVAGRPVAVIRKRPPFPEMTALSSTGPVATPDPTGDGWHRLLYCFYLRVYHAWLYLRITPMSSYQSILLFQRCEA